QAEDGIRDFHVTGVQTCALPISRAGRRCSPTWNTLPCQDRFVTAVSLPCRGSCGYTASVIAMKPVGVTAGPRGSVSGINAQEPLIRPGSGDPDPASDHLGPRGERQHAGTRRV